jgi:hypothetical protein
MGEISELKEAIKMLTIELKTRRETEEKFTNYLINQNRKMLKWIMITVGSEILILFMLIVKIAMG